MSGWESRKLDGGVNEDGLAAVDQHWTSRSASGSASERASESENDSDGVMERWSDGMMR